MRKYFTILIIVVVGYFIGNSIFVEITRDKTPGKEKRLACQKIVTSFERSFSNDDVKYAQSLIEHGSIGFSSHIEKSVYSKSQLFDHITLEEMDTLFRKKLRSYVKFNENNNSGYKISYYIYENDKKDPGKKSAKSKLYAGYVVLEVKNLYNKSIYKVQIDFMDEKGTDIKSSIDCTIKSFMTYNK
jgi:hypothetical protein